MWHDGAVRNAVFAIVCLTLLFGCDEETTGDDAGWDSGLMVRLDSGPRDAARGDSGDERDSGGSDAGRDAARPDAGADVCAADEDNARSTLGCNGPLIGPTQNPDEIDGPCTPDGIDGPGTCVVPMSGIETWCAPDDTDPSVGLCVYICPDVSTYVSGGGCPSGSRCFNLGVDGSYCYRDCSRNRDCFTGEVCDADGTCVL
ncbi:hypothetical protein JYT86_00435 [bacterium AH-315-N03]|nr:hypothetical protein [bacterium AH-315-N03]